MNSQRSSTIFIIDDEEIIVEMLTAILEAHGFTNLRGFTSSVDAIDALDEIRPDLILTDIHMPDASGKFLTKLVKSQNHLESVPVIAVTADDCPETHSSVLEFGARAILMKPVQPVELIRCVTDSLERSRRYDIAEDDVVVNLSKAKAEQSALLLGQETKLRGIFGRSSASGSDG